MTRHAAIFTWSLAQTPTRAAPNHFPYDHATVEQTASGDPAAYHAANKARFDRLYGPLPRRPILSAIRPPLADRITAARDWRRRTKPFFDAIYGT